MDVNLKLKYNDIENPPEYVTSVIRDERDLGIRIRIDKEEKFHSTKYLIKKAFEEIKT